MLRYFIALIVVVILITTIVFIRLSNSQYISPAAEISIARTAITSAMQAKSDSYAYPTLKRAQTLYDSAMNLWSTENERFILYRDYQSARNLANEAAKIANSALHTAKLAESELKHLVAGQLGRINKMILYYDQHYANVPLTKSLRQELANARLLYHEAKSAYERKDLKRSKLKLDSAEVLITNLTDHTHQLLANYFEEYDQWMKWVNKAIARSSREKTTSIVVDKFARECKIYKSGKLLKTLPIELGANWIGDKMHQGDKTTPEGNYHIVKTKVNGDTRYYKALLINYPNDEDEIRFRQLQSQGRIKKGVNIGNLIEIHGGGGKGVDWTDGCIALNNTDMDIVFGYSQVNTPVTIVGSLRPLDEILTTPSAKP